MTAAATSSTPANRRALLTFLRLFAGLCILAGLAFFLWTPGAWQNKLFVWVLLTILADECAGWFGYAGVALGLIVLFAPGATPEQWFVILPLIGAALFALLLLKHSGGPFVLPFAGLIFTGAVLAADRVGGIIDTPIRLLGSPEFQRMSVLPMVIGLGVSFVRQSVSGLLRWSARRRVAASASASSTAATPAAPAPAVATPAGTGTPPPTAPPVAAAPGSGAPVSPPPAAPTAPAPVGAASAPAAATVISADPQHSATAVSSGVVTTATTLAPPTSPAAPLPTATPNGTPPEPGNKKP